MYRKALSEGSQGGKPLVDQSRNNVLLPTALSFRAEDPGDTEVRSVRARTAEQTGHVAAVSLWFLSRIRLLLLLSWPQGFILHPHLNESGWK